MKRKSIFGVLSVVSIFAVIALMGIIPANAQRTGRVSFKKSQIAAVDEPQTNPASPIMADDFTYPIGSQLGTDGWVAYSSTVSPQTVTAGNLTYTGWPSSGGGNSATLTTTGEDDNHPFPL